MNQLLSVIKVLIVVIFLTGVGALFVTQYSYIFSRKVVGVVEEIERIDLNAAPIPSGQPAQPYSFAIGIREKSGEIVTASTEDRQWMVVKKGKCVEARFYPYPPWNLAKGGTFFNARLDRYGDCPGIAAPSENAELTAPSN